MHRCSRNDVAHRFIVQMPPVDERPANGVHKLLPYDRMREDKGDKLDGYLRTLLGQVKP